MKGVTGERWRKLCEGFYEWKRSGPSRQPFCFEVNDGDLFAFAGLLDRWRHGNGSWLKTFSILTTTPNAVTSAVHDRMPVIINPDAYDLWLDPGMKNVAQVCELLKPFEAGQMRCYPVSNRVNHVANDDEECSKPFERREDQQIGLFSDENSPKSASTAISGKRVSFGLLRA